MKNLIAHSKSLLLVSLFAITAALAGCSADTLTGVQEDEAPAVQSECRGSDCPNGHNL